jgi:hypothetical protein
MMENLFLVALALVIAAVVATVIFAARALVTWLCSRPFNGAYIRRRKAFLRDSVVASATILSVRITLGSINRTPVGQMRLEVHPPDPTQQAFEAQVEYLVPRWRVFRLGQTISVRSDPAQPAMLEVENVKRADSDWMWRLASQMRNASRR